MTTQQLARQAKAEGTRSGIIYGKRCRHGNADHFTAGGMSTWAGPLAGYVAQCEQFRCVDCGAWLSLGPSNDRGRRVRVEIAAARLIAGYHEANDVDDDLANPICRRVIVYMLGEAGMGGRDSREAFEIHDIATDGEP